MNIIFTYVSLPPYDEMRLGSQLFITKSGHMSITYAIRYYSELQSVLNNYTISDLKKSKHSYIFREVSILKFFIKTYKLK